MTPEYLLYKTWFVCIEPEEPSCKFLRGMPPAAASQRGAQCKTSEVTLFRPKQSVREDHHVNIQSLATKRITFNNFDLIKYLALSKQVSSGPIFCNKKLLLNVSKILDCSIWKIARLQLQFR